METLRKQELAQKQLHVDEALFWLLKTGYLHWQLLYRKSSLVAWFPQLKTRAKQEMPLGKLWFFKCLNLERLVLRFATLIQ